MRLVLCLALLGCVAAGFAAENPEPNPFIAGWDRPVDPDKDCKFAREKSGLTITVPGKDHDLAVERGLMNSPRLLRDVEGDFTAQVRLGGSFIPSDRSTSNQRIPFVGAGLVLMSGEKTYVRLERAAYRRAGVVHTYANWELRRDGKWELGGGHDVCTLKGKATWLRLQRKGDRILGWVSEDGHDWTEMKSLNVKLPARVKVGVTAGTTSTDPFSPHYDQFRLIKGKRN